MKISVVINTYNAEQYLERVLEAAKRFDEILICDMHSTDKTREIAGRFNCRIIDHEPTGIVEPARADAISQATHDWVLIVDADEIIPYALHEYLYYTIQRKPHIGGLRVARKNFLMGRFMRSAYPNHLIRFVKKDKVEWPTTIHAHPHIDGQILTIPAKRKDLALVHLANEPISVTIDKLNKYTDFELERRKNKKYSYLSLIIEPAIRFMRFYIFKGGFRDGIPGLVWAQQNANYKFITIAKVLESNVKAQDFDKDLKV